MITNLNSWSFEFSRHRFAKAEATPNKSVGKDSGSFICSLPSNDLSAARKPGLLFPQAFGTLTSAFRLAPDSCPLVSIRGSLSRHPAVNSPELSFLTFPNPLKSRVRTPSHVNQKFFLYLAPRTSHPNVPCSSPRTSRCVAASPCRFPPKNTQSTKTHTHPIQRFNDSTI